MENAGKKKYTAIIVGVLVLLIGIGMYSASNKNKKFKESGIRTEATILDMYEKQVKTKKTKRKEYYMDIAMYTNATADSTKSGNESKGDYQKATLNIESSAYKKYHIGEQVKVVYLKESPKDVRLLESVE